MKRSFQEISDTKVVSWQKSLIEIIEKHQDKPSNEPKGTLVLAVANLYILVPIQPAFSFLSDLKKIFFANDSLQSASLFQIQFTNLRKNQHLYSRRDFIRICAKKKKGLQLEYVWNLHTFNLMRIRYFYRCILLILLMHK
jgi:hypothetical protein